MQLNLSFTLAGLLTLSVMNSCKNTSMKDTVSDQSSMKPLVYPETRKDTVWDDFFGTRIDDPYRWLEDDHSEETKAWVKVQNELTFGYLDQIHFRKELRARIEKWFDYEKCGTPVKKAGQYYYFKNNGLQNQDVLYVAAGLKDSARMVIDPNTFSKDGTTSLSGFSFSKEGRYMAFQTSEGGSDWNKINILDLTTGNTLNDTIRWVKFSGTAWEADGFYYSRYPEPKGGTSSLSAKNEFHSVYYHKLGTDQSSDKLIYRDAKNPLRNAGTSISEDQRFLILSTMESTSGNGLAVKDLRKPATGFHWLVSAFDSDYGVIGNSGDSIFIHTNHESPNWKVFVVDMKNPKREHWKDLIPEGKDVLQSVNLLGGKLVCTYMENASSGVRIFDLKGNLLHKLALPELGTVGGFTGEADDEEAFYSFSSFIRPNTIYRLDLNSFQSELFFSPRIEGYQPELYTTSQVWYTSKDGTRVPMFLTHKKDLVKRGKAPTLLYAYGGFDISLLPSFSVTRLPILENDGIFAVANLRGGGEFGKEWHMAGTKERKQNVFDDFAAAADFLVAENYTDRNHLAIQGGSNGGLLIGATITQKPDICKVAFPAVGVLDMLRYHKFTIGWAWASDYGTSDTQEGFDYLIRYSPLHQAKPAAYPATLITTADHDDRVVPAHSFKFAAAMQQAQKAANPMLIRIDVSAGHGAGKPTSKRIDEAADVMSFMFYNMGITPDLK